MNHLRNRLLIVVALAVFAAAPLSGCGKKNAPKPPSKDSTYPKAYPNGAPRSDAAPVPLSTRQLAVLKDHGQ
jgi:hypothetical protein